jgi:hypothetical protein
MVAIAKKNRYIMLWEPIIEDSFLVLEKGRVSEGRPLRK